MAVSATVNAAGYALLALASLSTAPPGIVARGALALGGPRGAAAVAAAAAVVAAPLAAYEWVVTPPRGRPPATRARARCGCLAWRRRRKRQAAPRWGGRAAGRRR